jgi:hypothetical protein
MTVIVPKPELTLQLQKMSDLLTKWSPPKGYFDILSDWKNEYDLFRLNIDFMTKGAPTVMYKSGSLTLSRQRADKGKSFVLQIREYKEMTGEKSTLSAKVTCREDVLATPVEWSYSYDKQSPHDVKHYASFKETGSYGDGIVKKDGITYNTVESDIPLTLNYSLFEAVQRLSNKDAVSELKFNMLESFIAVRRNQILLDSGIVEVPFKDGPERFREFIHTGTGIMPTHYWLSSQGRLLIILRGMFLYCLKKEGN